MIIQENGSIFTPAQTPVAINSFPKKSNPEDSKKDNLEFLSQFQRKVQCYIKALTKSLLSFFFYIKLMIFELLKGLSIKNVGTEGGGGFAKVKPSLYVF